MSVTVQAVYNTFCSRVLEPGGLQLGIVTLPQFLVYFADAVNGFLRDTGISKVICTQTINDGVGQYVNPDRLTQVEALFVQGRFVARTNLESLDNSNFQWQRKSGPIKVWHEDGLPINVVELVPVPNWQGTSYPATTTPGYLFIDGTQQSAFFGTATSTGGNFLTWVSGDLFPDNGLLQGRQRFITFNGIQYVITYALDTETLLTTGPVTAGVALPYRIVSPVVIPSSDRNLTCLGSQIPTAGSYTLASVIPLMPDTATMYLGWAVLAKVYSDDGELKDGQKAMYCTARYQEGVGLFRSIMTEEIEDDPE